jgi:hypothetical protein
MRLFEDAHDGQAGPASVADRSTRAGGPRAAGPSP